MPLSQSKVRDLLSTYYMLDNFVNRHEEKFRIHEFLNKSDQIEKYWDSKYGEGIFDKVLDMEKQIDEFNNILKK